MIIIYIQYFKFIIYIYTMNDWNDNLANYTKDQHVDLLFDTIIKNEIKKYTIENLEEENKVLKDKLIELSRLLNNELKFDEGNFPNSIEQNNKQYKINLNNYKQQKLNEIKEKIFSNKKRDMIDNYIICYNNIKKLLLDYFGADISENKINLNLFTNVDHYNDDIKYIIELNEKIKINVNINKDFKKVISEVYSIIIKINLIQKNELNIDNNSSIIHNIYYNIINILIDSKQIPDYVKEAVKFFYSNDKIRKEKLDSSILDEIKINGEIIAKFFEIQNKEESDNLKNKIEVEKFITQLQLNITEDLEKLSNDNIYNKIETDGEKENVKGSKLINEKKPVVEKIKNSLVNEVVIFTHGASFYNNNAFVNNNNMKKFIINTKQDHIDNKFHSIIMKIFNLVKTYLEDNNKKKCLYKQDIKSIIYLNMIMKRICYLYYIRIIIKNIEEDENYIIQKSDLSKITYMNDNIEQIFKDINSNKEKIRQNKIDKEKISELESNIQALEDYKILDDTLTVSKIQDIAIYLKNYKQNYKKNINTEEKILDKIPEKKIPNKKLQKTTGNQNFEKINNFGKDKQVGGDFREIEEDNFNMKNFIEFKEMLDKIQYLNIK